MASVLAYIMSTHLLQADSWSERTSKQCRPTQYQQSRAVQCISSSLYQKAGHWQSSNGQTGSECAYTFTGGCRLKRSPGAHTGFCPAGCGICRDQKTCPRIQEVIPDSPPEIQTQRRTCSASPWCGSAPGQGSPVFFFRGGEWQGHKLEGCVMPLNQASFVEN